MKILKIIRIILMAMGAIWLLFIAWSYIGLPAVRGHGSAQSSSDNVSQLKIEERYEELKSYCSSLGLASGKEGITTDKKTTLFVGEHANLSNLSIITTLRLESDQNRSSVRYFIRCNHPRWSGRRSEDYKNLTEELTEIIRKDN